MGIICPAVGRRWLILLARYPPRSFVISFYRTIKAIHLPHAPDPDIFGKPFWADKRSAWALGLKQKGMDEQRRAWVKEGVLIPL